MVYDCQFPRIYTSVDGCGLLIRLPVPMHILMVTNLFYPRLGGSEQVVFESSRRLALRGHEVHVLTEQMEPTWPLYEQIDNIHVHRCPVRFGNPVVRFGSGVLNAARLFKRLVAEHHFDVLHFHLTLSAIGVLLCRESKSAARVASFYGPWDEEELIEKDVAETWRPHHIKATIFRLLQRYVLQHSARTIILSDYSRTQVNTLMKTREACVKIPGGVDLERFHPATDRDKVRLRLHLPRDQPVLLTIRRLVHRMGVDLLIEAMPSLLARIPDLMLVVGSDGPLRSTLEKRTDTLGIRNHIRFTGFISNEELPLYYQAADLFVMPTKALEGFGLPTIESMACGTPVLGTAIGSNTEIIGTFDTRLLIPEATAEAISKTVHSVFDLCASEDQIRTRCRQYVEERFNWDHLMDTLEETYRSLQD